MIRSMGVAPIDIPFHQLPWQQRLEFIVATMREMSSNTDPQRMVNAYIKRMRRMIPADRWMAISRRDLSAPRFRVTRSDLWENAINPWTDRGALPLLEGGLLAELIYGEEPRIIEA